VTVGGDGGVVCGCELGDELSEFGSGGCTCTRAGPVNVAFDGAYRQGEGLGDVAVGQALRDQGGDLAFAVVAAAWLRPGWPAWWPQCR